MKKELKDYAPFYLRCECIIDFDSLTEEEKRDVDKIADRKWLIEGFRILPNNHPQAQNTYITKSFTPYSDRAFINDSRIKLLLRPLSDMTDEEGKEAELEWNKGRMLGESISRSLEIAYAYRVEFLLSKHFDLFGLIEAGLAIDKTTLKQQS